MKYQEYFYRTEETRYFFSDSMIMFKSLEDLERFLIEFRKNEEFEYGGFFEIRVYDPFIETSSLPKEEDYYTSILESKALMSKYSSMRWLIISPDVKEIYGETIFAEYQDEYNGKLVRNNVKYFFDYGILYGNYKIPKEGEVFKTTFTNSFDEWGICDYKDHLDEDNIYIQISNDYSWINNKEYIDFETRRIGINGRLIDTSFNLAYRTEYMYITDAVPIASLYKDGICKKLDGKEFTDYLGAYESEIDKSEDS